ncbi:hypothetical protein LLE87_38320, partial [Paenibacillus polymyxa]|nr:hypothetical protein [Paenibacillus polymyxa]
ISPDGRRALIKSFSQAYLVDIPPANGGEPATVNLDTPAVARRKLTRVGADFIDWADRGATVTWSVGSTFRRLPTDQALN